MSEFQEELDLNKKYITNNNREVVSITHIPTREHQEGMDYLVIVRSVGHNITAWVNKYGRSWNSFKIIPVRMFKWAVFTKAPDGGVLHSCTFDQEYYALSHAAGKDTNTRVLKVDVTDLLDDNYKYVPEEAC